MYETGNTFQKHLLELSVIVNVLYVSESRNIYIYICFIQANKEMMSQSNIYGSLLLLITIPCMQSISYI